MSVEFKNWQEICKEKDERIKALEGKFGLIVGRLEHLLNNFGEHCEEYKDGRCYFKSCAACVLNHAIEMVKEVGGLDG